MATNVAKNLFEKGASRTMWNCDRCCNSRIKCSKSLPHCDQCLKRGIACIYSREHKKKRTMGAHPDFYNKVFSFNIKKDSEETESKSVLPIKFYKPVISTSSLSLRPVAQAYHFRWVHMLKVWSLLKPNPKDWSSSLDIFLSIFFKVLNKDKKISTVTKVSITNSFEHPSFNPAVSAYFKYANPFLPLFTKEDFLAHSRSSLLLMAVWVRGLTLLPFDIKTNELRIYLQDRLIKKLRVAYTFPCLDTVQALLVTLNGLQSYYWGGTSTGLFYGAIIDMAHLLGLHRSVQKIKLQPHICRERKLAYCCILFIDGLQAWNIKSHCFISLEHTSVASFIRISNYMDNISKLCLHSRSDGSPRFKYPKSIYTLCSSIMSDTLVYSSVIFQRMNIIRYRLSQENKKTPLTCDATDYIKNILSKVFMQYIKYYETILKHFQLTEEEFKQLSICQHYLDVQLHTFVLDLFTIQIKIHERLNILKTLDQNDTFQKDTTAALDAASRVVLLDKMYPKEPYNMYRVQLLTNALVFLIHHHSKYNVPKKILSIIKTGCSTLETLQSYPTYRQMATLSEILIEKTLKQHKIRLK